MPRLKTVKRGNIEYQRVHDDVNMWVSTTPVVNGLNEVVSEAVIRSSAEFEYEHEDAIWRATQGGTYKYITQYLQVRTARDNDEPEDVQRYDAGNYFMPYLNIDKVLEQIREVIAIQHAKNRSELDQSN